MSHKWWNVFLDTEIFKGPHFSTLKILNSQSHCKPIETFQCTHFSSCHPFNMKRGFIKEEALSLLRTNLVRRILTNTNKIFNKDSVTEAILWRLFIKSFLKFSSPSQQRPFITKQRRWKKFYHLLPLIIQPYRILKRFSWKTGTPFNSSLDLHISFNQPPILSYRKEKSHKDISIHAKLPSIMVQS